MVIFKPTSRSENHGQEPGYQEGNQEAANQDRERKKGGKEGQERGEDAPGPLIDHMAYGLAAQALAGVSGEPGEVFSGAPFPRIEKSSKVDSRHNNKS